MNDQFTLIEHRTYTQIGIVKYAIVRCSLPLGARGSGCGRRGLAAYAVLPATVTAGEAATRRRGVAATCPCRASPAHVAPVMRNGAAAPPAGRQGAGARRVVAPGRQGRRGTRRVVRGEVGEAAMR